MKLPHRLAAIALVASAAGVVTAAPPASAAVVVTVSGTTLTVAVTGTASITFDCSSGNVRVNQVVTSPTLACATFSKATVNGDDSVQNVDGWSLDDATAFPAGPYLVGSLAGGNDTVYTTGRADSLNLGAGYDYAYVSPGGLPDTTLNFAADEGWLELYGTGANDAYTATSGSFNLAVGWNDGTSSVTYTAQNVDILRLDGRAGNDTFATTGITAASTISRVDALGDDGNDTFTTGAVASFSVGGAGTNTFNGGAGDDQVDSNSATDVIHLGNGNNYLYDRYNPKFGSRAIDVTSSSNGYSAYGGGTDAVFRVRPPVVAGTVARITGSINRDGQQDLPNGFRYINLGLSENYTDPDTRGIADIVVPTGGTLLFTPYGDNANNDLLDVTVPGDYTTSGTAATTLTIHVTGGGYAEVQATAFGPVSIHTPWANPNRGFVHRATRDLMFRFATTAQLDAGQASLGAGTTRPQFVSSLMGTDEYRGLDVDRVFTKYLRRTSDPSGRTFWINRLREGRALWRFRAQLFGSPEYFTKAGGTNEAFVRRAYADVLNRDPDPSGLAHWVNKLDGGADRGSVALQYLNSAEARRRLVDGQFLRFLDRLPTATEQNTWVAAIPSDDGEQRLIASLAASTSYYNRS